MARQLVSRGVLFRVVFVGFSPYHGDRELASKRAAAVTEEQIMQSAEISERRFRLTISWGLYNCRLRV